MMKWLPVLSAGLVALASASQLQNVHHKLGSGPYPVVSSKSTEPDHFFLV